MWSVEHTASSDASPDVVWPLFSDPATWTQWNPTLADVSFAGPFEDGTPGTLKPQKGPKSKVTLHDVQSQRGFVTASKLPGAELRVEHELVPSPTGGSLITERSVLQGPLARVWALVMGRQLGRDMKAAVEGQ